MKNEILEVGKSKLIPIKSIIGYSVLAIISGLSGFAFITIINKVIKVSLETNTLQTNDYLYMFLTTITVFFITRRWLSAGIVKLSQEIFWSIRKDVVKLVLKAPYRKLQEYRDEVYSILTADVNNITNASVTVITFFSSVILIISCLIYMAFLSMSLFSISLGTIVVGVLIYIVRSRKSNRQLTEVREIERSFVSVFNSILDGSKEININKDKGLDIYNRKFMGLMNSGERKYVKALIQYINSEITGQLLFYSLITFILIYGNSLLGVTLDVSISFVLVLLYLLGPIVTVMSSMPIMNRAKVSLYKMNKLKKELHKIKEEYYNEDKKKYNNFRRLKLKDYSFSYGEGKFSVGPINLDVNRNEIVFIHGGNGAGKTTFINTLLRLYDINSGEAYIDDTIVSSAQIDEIKEMFSPVFSDFYLFDEFYGVENVDVEKVNFYLRLFELEEKVSLIDGKFSTIDLSTGQRKRLALISALLEEKPILVLDEWAADQDPYFRHKFYTEILSVISKKEDKTIIAITHDDRYYDVADKLLKMEYGQLKEINKTKLEAIFS